MKNIHITRTLFLVLIFTILACSKSKKEEKMIRPVIYQKVNYLGSGEKHTFSGFAQTDKIINLSFRSTGIMTMLNMKLGQKVKKGECLAKLDNVQARLNYEKAISAFNSSESQMNTSKLNLNRVRSLYEIESSSLSDYEIAKNSYRTAVSSYEAAKRSISIQKEQVHYGYLYAPEDGVIASVNAEIDENIAIGQKIGVLNAGATMEISLGIPESYINKIKQDMEVKIYFTSLKSQNFIGKVTEISPAIDNNTSTYPLKVAVTNPTPDIKSGMATQVAFEFSMDKTHSKTIVAPIKAVGKDGRSNFVFIIEENQDGIAIVKKQNVIIGALTSEGFEIKKGLQAGQKIATAGLQTLLDGQEVKL